MPLQAYQFIKYTTPSANLQIGAASESGAVVCFDFEDGQVNPFDGNHDATLKALAREQFAKLNKASAPITGRIGVRVNPISSEEFEKDLIVLEGRNLEALFVPKISQRKELDEISEKLKNSNIQIEKLIPIIESKIGLENLETLLEGNSEISLIAFGHCDYNLDIGAFPFFHQDSWQYWKWMHVLTKTATKYHVRVINSPYLCRNNDAHFEAMLGHLKDNENLFHGQVTLSAEQSRQCLRLNGASSVFKELLKSTGLVAMGKAYALELVSEFERNNKTRGLSKSKDKFISLQEYKASKNFIEDIRPVNEFCFVGGCFAVQHTIVFEDLFHQQLKRRIEGEKAIRLNINIIRYARLNTVLERIETLLEKKGLNQLVFHIQPEPYLRMVKAMYRYTNEKGKVKWSLNLAILDKLNSETYDYLEMPGQRHIEIKTENSKLHQFLISCNYLLGTLLGNERIAKRRYQMLCNDVINLCKGKNISCLLLGPNRRSNTLLEPLFCKALDEYISMRTDSETYVSGFIRDDEEKMNMENGIHVTQAYHDRIGERLYAKLRDMAPKN